jgi:signal transduction histidine kinase
LGSGPHYQRATLFALTKWTIAFGLPVAAINLLGYVVNPTWTTPVGSGVTVVLALIAWWCRWQAHHGFVRRAARVYLLSGMLLMTSIIAIANKPDFLIGVMGLSAFVAIATFFSPPRWALLWGLLSVVLYEGVVIARGRLGTLDLGSEPAAAILYLAPPVVLMFFAVIGRIMVQHLVSALEESETSRRELAQSHAEIEHRVEERTRDLLAERNQLNAALQQLAIARDQAEAANQAKTMFIATMSHELRTPLTAILGYSELLLNDDIHPESLANHHELQAIWSAGQHLLALINNLLDLSKIEADKLDIHPETFELAGMIDDVITTVRPLAEKNNNRLNLKLDCANSSIYTDQTRLRQVLINILSNAAKFTKCGTITLTIDCENRDNDAWIVFQVADTGIGITPEYMPHLFEVFSQADSSTTRRYGGSGLGLALSRHLCRLLGGDISLESVHGKGTLVTIRLPTQPS